MKTSFPGNSHKCGGDQCSLLDCRPAIMLSDLRLRWDLDEREVWNDDGKRREVNLRFE